jgi:hypothetical protein
VYWRENPEFSIYIYFGISKIFKLWSYYIIWIASGRIINIVSKLYFLVLSIFQT